MKTKRNYTIVCAVIGAVITMAGCGLNNTETSQADEESISEVTEEQSLSTKTGHEYIYADYDLGIKVALDSGWCFKPITETDDREFTFWAYNEANSKDYVITLNETSFSNEKEALEKDRNGLEGYGEEFDTIPVYILGENKEANIVYNKNPEEYYTGVTYVPVTLNGRVYMLYGFSFGTIEDAREILNHCTLSFVDKSVENNTSSHKVVLPEDPNNPKEEIEQKAMEFLLSNAGITEEDIQFVDYDDFDYDGVYEAFAITGKKQDYDSYDANVIEGSIWFITPDKCVKLKDSDGMGILARDRIMDFINKKYVLFDAVYATGLPTYAFCVDGSDVSEATFSFHGEITDPNNEGEFRIIDSSYDAEYDPDVEVTLGHTWKSYYFYFDNAQNAVREYEGKEISAEDANSISGRNLVEECLKPDDNLESIINRSNGLIHVNYSRTDSDKHVYYFHRTWDCNNECFIDDMGEKSDEECEGTYSISLCPMLAGN